MTQDKGVNENNVESEDDVYFDIDNENITEDEVVNDADKKHNNKFQEFISKISQAS
ncbi:MAG: hypothetical protein ACKUBY_01430 [Candidatus Moraniibacteriota bacterium]|jgi:hypothetical protein